MKRILLIIFILSGVSVSAQVGIGTTTPSSSSELEIVSTDKGILIPRIALTNTGDTSSITSGNIVSLLVYNTASSGDITPGYYYWDGFKWQRLTVSDDVDTKEPWFGTDDNAAATGNTEDMYLMSSKVGIGTITPEARLNVIQSGSIGFGSLENAALLVGTTTNGIGLDNNQIANYGSSLFFESEDGFTLSADVNSDGQINVNTSDKIMNIAKNGDISMDYNLYVLGNAGVGTVSPTSKLDVYQSTATGSIFKAQGLNGDVDFVDMDATNIPTALSSLTTQSGMFLKTPQSRNFVMQIRNNDTTDGFHIINTSEEHIMAVNAGNRRVGIGVVTPLNTLHVSRDIEGSSTPSASQFVAKFENNADPATATGPVVWIQGGQNTYSSNSELIRFARPNGARIGGVRQTATTTVAYTTTSDGRLKTNVKNLTNGIATINSMAPVSYNWKIDPNGKSEIGFIAQELYKVYPHAVVKGDDTDIKNTYQVDYSKLTPVLVQAVKEQQKMIDQLKSENEALKVSVENITRLEGEIQQIKRLLLLKENTPEQEKEVTKK